MALSTSTTTTVPLIPPQSSPPPTGATALRHLDASTAKSTSRAPRLAFSISSGVPLNLIHSQSKSRSPSASNWVGSYLSQSSSSFILPLPVLSSPSRVMSDPRPRRRWSKHFPNDTQPTLPTRRFKVLSQAAIDEQNGTPSLNQQGGSSKHKTVFQRLFSGSAGLLMAIVAHLLTATLFLAVYEGWHMLDALYFAVVIATTVGYGDITPNRPISKIFVALYAVVSVAIIANLLQRLVERFAAAQREMASSAKKLILGGSTSYPDADDASTFKNKHDLVSEYKRIVDQTRLKLQTTLLVFVITCLSGILLYKYFLNESLIDVIYFLCISMTTVGLGDIHPKSRFGKGFATVWLILTSLGFANLLAQAADLRLRQREYETAKHLLSGSLSHRIFDEMDGNNDESLSEAEYLGYVVCKMGKASPDDVRAILTRFRQLDVDASGFITKEDIDLALKKEV